MFVNLTELEFSHESSHCDHSSWTKGYRIDSVGISHRAAQVFESRLALDLVIRYWLHKILETGIRQYCYKIDGVRVTYRCFRGRFACCYEI